MELELVNFEQAKTLKELGFPQEVHPWHLYDIHTGILHKDYDDSSPLYLTENDTCMAPTLELAAKWLREEKGIYVTPSLMYYNKPIDGWKHIQFEACVVDWHWNAYLRYEYYSTYEKALSAGIDKAIEILNDK